MAYQPDKEIEIAPLILPLTRPTMIWGVPRGAVIFEMVLVAMTFLQTRNIFALLLFLPLHATLYVLTIRDPRFIDIVTVWTRKCLPVPNKSFWGGNSYIP